MKIKDILAKASKAEALTDEEKKFLEAYDPDKAANDAAASARRKAEEERDTVKKELDKLKADAEAAKKAAEAKDGASKTETEKLMDSVKKLTDKVESLTKAKADAEAKAATVQRSQGIRDAAKAAGIMLAPKTVSEQLFFQMLEARLSGVDIADKAAITAALDAFKVENPGIIATAGGGTGGAGGDPLGGGNTSKNPWAKETFNLTEQGNLFARDPAKAMALAAEAGVTI